MVTRPSVLVTGASKGIGKACALRLDKLGFDVFATVRQQSDHDALREAGSQRLTPIFMDVTDEDSIQTAVESVTAKVGEAGLSGLVNNAGIAVAGPMEFLPIVEFRKQLEVNVVGQVAVIQAFLPLLRKGKGRVVNVGSINGKVASPLTGAYTSSKFALEGLTDTLRMELDPWDIHVSLVQPGAVVTSIWDSSISAGDALLAESSPQISDLYGLPIQAVREYATRAQERGVAPEAVAQVVEHAITAKRPKTRYLVARHTWQVRFLLLLPDRWRDWLIRRKLLADAKVER